MALRNSVYSYEHSLSPSTHISISLINTDILRGRLLVPKVYSTLPTFLLNARIKFDDKCHMQDFHPVPEIVVQQSYDLPVPFFPRAKERISNIEGRRIPGFPYAPVERASSSRHSTSEEHAGIAVLWCFCLSWGLF